MKAFIVSITKELIGAYNYNEVDIDLIATHLGVKSDIIKIYYQTIEDIKREL